MVDIFLIKFDPTGAELFRYLLGNFKRFSYDINSPVTPAPLPEEDSDENVLVKIEGNSSAISLSWKILDTPTNREQLVPVATKTVFENLLFFKNQFRSVSINDSYALLIDDSLTPITWFGTITQIHTDTIDGENLTLNANCKFMEGNVVALYDIDVPSPPQNFSAVAGGTGEIDLTWTAPFDEGSTGVIGYRIQFAIIGQDFTNKDVGVVLSDTLTGLVSNEIYQVRVAAISNNGVGRFTFAKEVTVL